MSKASTKPAQSKPQKQPPFPGLIIFRSDGANFREAKAALGNHCLSAYGEVANFITTGVPIVRPTPTAEFILANYPDFGGADRGKILLSLLADHRTQVRLDGDAYSKMFGLFLQLNEDDGTERIKSHADWPATAAALSAPWLWRIMSVVHTTHINNVSAGEALYNAMSRYSRCVQSTEMSTAVYRESLVACVAVLEALNHPNVPNAAAQARHMVHGLDKMRYGEYVADVLNNERRAGAPFPQTLQEVVDGARSFIPSAAVHQAQSNVLAYNARINSSKPPDDGCRICGSKEHWKRDCPRNKKKSPAAAAAGTTAGGATAAAAAAAPASDGASAKPARKAKQKPKKAYSTSISTEAVPSSEVFWDEVFNAFKVSINAHQVGIDADAGEEERDPRIIALDTYADHSFTDNMDLIADPRRCDFKVKGATGVGRGSIIGRLPGFGPIAYTPDSGASGLAISAISSRYPIEFVSEVAFFVKVSDDFTLEFRYSQASKIYACRFDDELISRLLKSEEGQSITALPVAVEQLERQYSKTEVQRAREAVLLSNKLYSPPAAVLASLLTNGDILNCPITAADVALADSIYGDAAYQKGRAKFKGPTAARDVVVPTAKRREQTVYADIMFWHGLPFVIFVCKLLMLVLSQYISGAQNLANMKDAFLILCNKLIARGFSIGSIVVDPQSSLAALTNRVPFVIDVVGTGSHVGDAEVEIKLLKEKLRSKDSTLKWPVPKRVVRWLVYGATSVTNMFRRKGAIQCPRTEFTGIKLDFR